MENCKVLVWKYLIVASAFLATAAYPQTITTQFFGLTTLSTGITPLLSPGIVRTQDAYGSIHLDWNDTNPSAGTYDWASLDTFVSTTLGRGQLIDFVLGGTPTWASSNPTGTPTGAGDPGSNFYPSNISIWNDWVTAVATRYKGEIKYYEIWNEPNAPVSWNGTQADLLTLAQSAYSIIHSIDSNALVMTPTATEQVGATWLDTYLSQTGAPASADVVTFHSYNGNSDYASAEEQYSLIQDYKTVAANHSMASLPLISTEGSWGGGSSYITNPTQQANYLAKYMVEHAMQGVTSAIWYAADAGAQWGELYTSGALNAAGLAYQQVQTWLIGATVTSQGIDNHGTYHLSVTCSNGSEGLVVWNSTANQIISVPGYTNSQSLTGANTPVSGGTVIATTSPIFVTGP